MPDSMYDKLGELLSEALDSGNFFYENPYSAQNTQQKSYEKEKIIDSVQEEKKNPHEKSPHKNKILLKNAGTEIQKAAKIIGITDEMSLEDARKNRTHSLKLENSRRVVFQVLSKKLKGLKKKRR